MPPGLKHDICSCTLVGVIFFIQARRLVTRGFLSFLTYVWDVSRAVPSVEFVPIVCVFVDVFPIDLLGLPLGFILILLLTLSWGLILF